MRISDWSSDVCSSDLFVCDGSLARRPLPDLWNRARRIAADALTGRVEKEVGTAPHYHADYVFPRWAPHLAKMAQIGAHIRSEERRVGKECVRTCRSRCSPNHSIQNNNIIPPYITKLKNNIQKQH